MAPLVSLLYGLSALTAVTQVIANPSRMPGYGKRDDYAEVGGVDTSNPIVDFLDYQAIADAAAEAVSDELERRGLPLEQPKKKRTFGCSKVSVRKEWRKLSRTDQKNYIKATKCLTTKSDFGISPYSEKLFDAFVYIHENNWFAFHGCAPFPPWHRWFVWLREVALRDVCGYNGVFPYWNYSLDWKDPFASPIFSSDPEVGFGSHGTTPYMAINSAAGTASGFKVDNGAFANFMVNLPEPHYLTRNFTLWKDSDPTGQYGKAFGNWFGPEQLAKTLAANSFWDFEKVLDGIGAPQSLGIHNGPHFNNNGDWYGPGWLSNTTYFPFASTAPNDPMFFPHHAYVDAVFWKWQQKSGKQWLYGGSNNISDPTMNDAKLTDMLPFSGFGPDIPVALTLKTENFPLCYTYEF